jgi:hypothetical protein
MAWIEGNKVIVLKLGISVDGIDERMCLRL